MNISEMEKLFSDERFIQLCECEKQDSMFDVIGRKRREEWHSAVVGWLLSPSSSHGLGVFPIQRLLGLYASKQSGRPNAKQLTPEEIYLISQNMELTLEKRVKGGYIDIFLKGENLNIVIENKIEALENFHENIGQTSIYYKCITEKYKNSKNIFIFLTAIKNQIPDDNDHYICIDYQELYDNVILPSIGNPIIENKSKILLEEYSKSLTSVIKTGNPIALIHKKMCEEIYKEYEEIFEAIKKAVGKSNEECSPDSIEKVAYSTYQSVFDEIFVSNGKEKPKSSSERLSKINVDYVIEKNILKEGDMLYHKYPSTDIVYEVDVKKDENGFYLIVGEFDREAIPDKNGNARFKTFNEAAKVAQENWREKCGKECSSNTVSAPEYWKTDKGIKLAELLHKI